PTRRSSDLARLLVERGESDGDGDAHLRALHQEGLVGDEGAQPLRRRVCLPCVGLGEDDHEFLAAITSEDVGLAQKAQANPRRELLENAVARQMPVGVVEPLEVVDVEEEQREGAAMAKTANHLLFQVLDEVTAVVGPRQHVRDGEAAKLLQVGGLHVALAQQFVDDLPDLEAVAHFDPCRLVDWEAPAVEPGAVGRPQLGDANLATLDADGAVAPGNAFDAEDDRTGIAAAEDGLALGEKDARADARPLELQQEVLGLLPSGRRLDHLGEPGFVMHASNLPPRLLVAGAGDLEGEKFVDRKSLYLQPGAKQANGNSNAIPLAHLDGGKRNRELQDASESPRPHHAIFHAKLDLSLRSGPPLEFERPAPRTHLDGDPLEGHLADGRLDARVEAKEEMAFVETKVH